jgi:hypothetical protein
LVAHPEFNPPTTEAIIAGVRRLTRFNRHAVLFLFFRTVEFSAHSVPIFFAFWVKQKEDENDTEQILK